MNSNQQPQWKKKLEEIEAEISNSSQNPLNAINSEKSKNIFMQVKNWFISLPAVGKVIVGLFGFAVTISLLKAVFSLVQLAISLAFLSVIVYFVYQFFIKSKA
ncbi:hypothetical protein VKI21_06050 [Cyanobacterium aponinum UTEX 3222]|uniref:Uncharacterized protein n=3 Tax=Cyanobacterium aponinum TaxID=379064 RepID=K9Z8T7_CYAAP|nr:hypothetical protein [Cyanobacterium aponinum]WRL43245.1 hypothetical protein VKI21_06050 [Cyanobacterium aponinum UTEX 3222]AFZ54773.1 hypothetical protein Cyan10605_2700 [Cyanobacterium aponinum PCC 10605]MTF38280.1 hypothetical protein [Cyanobacterium aponinum 0216]PHV64037.1 hypothetical protein CSQ80_01965 [Cyanobacterium aponinum IPPAS B-1201]WPF87850.1 hypothetical protein SAY89_13740 [Cyanobacterium aponinum AL20115]